MKKAEDYFDIMSSLIYIDCDEYRDDAYRLIKIVQEDTIRDTVEECSKSAGVVRIGRKTQYLPTGSHFKTTKVIAPVYGVDKNSILSVADKLIKELE